MTFTEISEEYFSTGNALCFTGISVREDGQRFRTRIKRDAYDRQSHALVEVWTTSGWTEVLRHHDITTLRIGGFSYVSRDKDRWSDAISIDAGDLLVAASRIVP